MIGVTREYCYSLLKGEHASQKIVETIGRVLNLPIRGLYTKPNEIESIYNPYEIVFDRTEHYKSNDIVTFGKLNGEFGALSNMSTVYPVECCGYKFKTSEHLFIALRFSGYSDLQRDIMEYKNSMYCKKVFINAEKYKQYHHLNWHDDYFDVEVMKYIVNLKYAQNKGFQKLLAKTKGKIIVEDTTMQNSASGVLRWGCQDLQKKDLVRAARTSTGCYIRSFEKDALAKTASLKRPRSASKQKSFDDKLKAQLLSMNDIVDICEQTILAHCNYTLIGENAMG